MAATLLADGVSEITNAPHLKDMKTMSDVLRVIGCRLMVVLIHYVLILVG
jgi:UDP-N-acetylglucosamine 1-carboxyvinyltransferase